MAADGGQHGDARDYGAIDAALERCRPWLLAALDRSDGAYSWSDVVAEIKAGTMQLWPAERGAAVTQILDCPQKRILHVFLAGGELDQLRDMIDSAAEWGRACGCSEMQMTGRAGWRRRLPGWREIAVTMGRSI